MRIPRRFASANPINVAVVGRSRSRRFFAVGGLAMVALAPAGHIPLPTLPISLPVLAGPGLPAPVTAGAVLRAVDDAGHPLAYAQFEVYRADQPEGVQQPLFAVPAVSSTGTVTVPLPAPSTIPDAASNYYAVSTGLASDGASASGIEFFNLTAQNPLATAIITPNLFQVPPVTIIGNPPPIGDPPSVPPAPNPSDTPTVPSVTDWGQLPPVGNPPTVAPSPTTPPATGPCGFQPDTEHPAPPASPLPRRTCPSLTAR